MNEKIRVILFQEQGLWLAQGIDLDICVQAHEIEDLFSRFQIAVRLECDDAGKLDHLPPAPEHFQRMWNERSAMLNPIHGDYSQYDVGMAA